MIKEIVAYILLFFGVIVAIIGTVFYLRMYKAMIGKTITKREEDHENSTKTE